MSDRDWVSALAACSAAQVFEQIRLQVEADVKVRNAVRPTGSDYKFETASDGDSFSVLIKGRSGQRVTFQKTDRGILVYRADGTQMIEATLTLNDEGDCRFRVNGQEREFWQFRKTALESLFFDIKPISPDA
jgi:hypothetical protein